MGVEYTLIQFLFVFVQFNFVFFFLLSWSFSILNLATFVIHRLNTSTLSLRNNSNLCINVKSLFIRIQLDLRRFVRDFTIFLIFNLYLFNTEKNRIENMNILCLIYLTAKKYQHKFHNWKSGKNYVNGYIYTMFIHIARISR